jgi:hypothetical protein
MDIPIVGSDYLVDSVSSDRKVVFVPLAWNFFNEIKTRIKNKRNNNGDLFIKYFPSLEITNNEG